MPYDLSDRVMSAMEEAITLKAERQRLLVQARTLREERRLATAVEPANRSWPPFRADLIDKASFPLGNSQKSEDD